MNEAHLDFCGSEAWRAIVCDLIIPEALAGVELGPDVVEIGPGPGFTTDVLRARARHLTAVELDPDLARALAARLVGSNVEVVQGDATALDFADDAFTGAACFSMLHHVPPDAAQDRVLGELGRVLRPDGALVAVDSVGSDELRDFHEGDTYHPIDPDALPARLDAAGFTDVAVRTYDLGWIATALAG
jgi:SAM-dependent methyltransferase